ncbi:unnamed protein product [Protopolystoma xenopodis]|uniref:Uncharacterized protein n=1 Tax=Protopolystoma xenopodis TaxID=117903 RepID=A0A448WA27_9PLAT|nr:unnamed protein product [Protopolystoma xenopodis]
MIGPNSTMQHVNDFQSLAPLPPVTGQFLLNLETNALDSRFFQPIRQTELASDDFCPSGLPLDKTSEEPVQTSSACLAGGLAGVSRPLASSSLVGKASIPGHEATSSEASSVFASRQADLWKRICFPKSSYV